MSLTINFTGFFSSLIRTSLLKTVIFKSSYTEIVFRLQAFFVYFRIFLQFRVKKADFSEKVLACFSAFCKGLFRFDGFFRPPRPETASSRQKRLILS